MIEEHLHQLKTLKERFDKEPETCKYMTGEGVLILKSGKSKEWKSKQRITQQWARRKRNVS